MARRTAAERFQAKVRVDDSGCHIFIGTRTHNGYGQFWYRSRKILAHRYAYEKARGPIPDGLQIDHLCRTRACVNPEHLDIVTPAENVRRGEAACILNTGRCRKGLHDTTLPGATVQENGRAKCRACRRESQRRYEDRQRGAP